MKKKKQQAHCELCLNPILKSNKLSKTKIAHLSCEKTWEIHDVANKLFDEKIREMFDEKINAFNSMYISNWLR